MDKKQIRKKMRQERECLTDRQHREYSDAIRQRVYAMPEFQASRTIYSFVSFGREPDTRQLILDCLQQGRRVCVPKVENGQMKFYVLSRWEELHPGFYGILEPESIEEDQEKEGFLLLPGLAFDRQFHRIGYGGGYYDRYLNDCCGSFCKTALCYSFQIQDCIPAEPFDCQADAIVTEKELFYRTDRPAGI